MARRIKTEDSDSCELMLDTICNVFGGMILMAVLVVIQTQATVARLPQAEQEAAEASLDIRKVEFEIGRQETSIAALKLQQSDLKDKYSAKASPLTDELLTRRQAFKKAIEDAKRRITDGTKKHQADQDNLKNVRAQHGQAEETLKERRDQISRVRREQMRLDRISRKKIRLPKTHQIRGSTQVDFLIRGKRVYPREAIRIANGGREAIPIEGKGFIVDRQGKVEGLAVVLSKYNRRTHYVILWVAENNDSFESFQVVREMVVAKGFNCGYVAQNRVFAGGGYDRVE